jgi:leader peptidase (prepilin peptidase) / N-methyltransferase
MMVPLFALPFGLIVGSFLNVVAYRVPRRESVRQPGFALSPLRYADPGHARYPLVEAGTGLLFAALAWRLERLDLLSALPAYLWFASAGVALALIDLELRRLPNAIIFPSYPVLAVLLAASAAWQHD